MSKIIVIGFFQETIELCERCGYEIAGYVDNERLSEAYEYLGNDEEFLQKRDIYVNIPLFLTPDNPTIREKLYDLYSEKGFSFQTVISPLAIVSKSAMIGEGCMVQDGCNISSGVELGKCVRVNSMANCMHDVVVDDFCVVAPSSVLLGHVVVKNKAYIGANATVLPNIVVDGGIVGAGAVLTKNVKNKIAVGVPAEFRSMK